MALPQTAEVAPLAEKSLIAIVGPTASGKTDLALALARRLNGELVSADSRQLYKELDAGTAKPADTGGIRCHLVDVIAPSETMDAARFAQLARQAIDEIRGRGAVPIVVGGTGLYVKALLDGLDPLPPKSPEIREKLAEQAEINGRHWLHERLTEVDPEAARRIPPGNLQRVVRALEVYEITGKPISSFWTKIGPSDVTPAPSRDMRSGTAGEENELPAAKAGAPMYFGIQWSKEALRERIETRCERMWPAMIEEVRRLVPAKYSGREPGFQSIGYPEVLRHLAGELPQEQALRSMIKNTMDYAKRQATWFRRQASVRWIDAGDGDPELWADAVGDLLRDNDSVS